MNKPVAWLIQTKTAHQFTFKEPTTIPIDAVVEPLYTHPVKELTDEEIAVAHVPLMAWEVFSSSLFRLENKEITNDEFIKRCYEVVKARCNHPQPDYTQNNTQSHPVKELTDEEILKKLRAEISSLKRKVNHEYIRAELALANRKLTDKEITEIYFDDPDILVFARAILRKAQEK